MSFRYPWRRLALLPRIGKQIILLLSDCLLLLLSAYLAFVMRLGFVFVPTQTQIFLIAIAPLLRSLSLFVLVFIGQLFVIWLSGLSGRSFRLQPLQRSSGWRWFSLWNHMAGLVCRVLFRFSTGF